MITIISSTIRSNNNSLRVAETYSELLKKQELNNKILDLQVLPKDFVFNNNIMGEPNSEFNSIVDKFILPANKFIFIVPEYNGGFPGAIKAFIDGISPQGFYYKKACLVGLSAGRMGNCRGLDQLTNVLNYLNVLVMPQKLTLPRIEDSFDNDNLLTFDEDTLTEFHIHVNQTIKF